MQLGGFSPYSHFQHQRFRDLQECGFKASGISSFPPDFLRQNEKQFSDEDMVRIRGTEAG